MTKFEDVKLDDEIYSIVFGLGKVIFVLAKGLRLDGYYVFEVEYNNGQKVHYTEDGKPNWCKDINKCTKTIHYKNEINFEDFDTHTEGDILKKYQISKLMESYMLEMMSPAGAWIDASLMPDMMVQNALNSGEYNLFREMKI